MGSCCINICQQLRNRFAKKEEPLADGSQISNEQTLILNQDYEEDEPSQTSKKTAISSPIATQPSDKYVPPQVDQLTEEQKLKESFAIKVNIRKKMGQSEDSESNSDWETEDWMDEYCFLREDLCTEGKYFEQNSQVDKYPFDCIGLILTKQYQNIQMTDKRFHTRGTGFLIAPNLVLTAAHNVVDKQRKPYLQIEFFPMLHGSIHQAEKYEAEEVCVLHDYSPREDAAIDYALVKLSRHVEERKKYIMIGQDYPKQENKKAKIIGYPAIKGSDLVSFKQYFAEGFIRDIIQENIRYHINTSKGQSGSPIMIQFVEGLYFAVGIHNKSDIKRQFNYGCHLSNSKMASIAKWVNQKAPGSKLSIVDFTKIKSLSNVTYSGIIKKNELTPEIELYLKMIKIQKEKKDNFIRLEGLLFETGKKFRRRGDYEDSLTHFKQALTICQEHSEIGEKQIAYVHFELGITLMALKQYEQSLMSYERGIKIFRAHNQQKSLIGSLKNIGNCYSKLQRYDQAERLYNQAYELDRNDLDKNPEKLAFYESSFAYLYLKQQRFEKAQQLYLKALNRKKDQMADAELCACYFNLAQCHGKQGKFEESINGYYQALKIMIQLNLTSHQRFKKYMQGFKSTLEKAIGKTSNQIQLSFVRTIEDLKEHASQFSSLKEKIMSRISSLNF